MYQKATTEVVVSEFIVSQKTVTCPRISPTAYFRIVVDAKIGHDISSQVLMNERRSVI